MSDPVRVKLCGLSRADDVRVAVEAGADYVGFVLAPGSPRSMRPAALAALLRDVDTGGAQRVGVVRDQPAAWINEVVLECGLDYVQLHGHEPRDFAAALVVPALRVRGVQAAADEALPSVEPSIDPLAPAPLPPNVFAILLDSVDARGRGGGSGRRADPAAVRSVLAALPAGTRTLLAGGLTPENVAGVVRRLRPWGVDVSSGVESAPGVKDAARMRAFVQAAKSAA